MCYQSASILKQIKLEKGEVQKETESKFKTLFLKRI